MDETPIGDGRAVRVSLPSSRCPARASSSSPTRRSRAGSSPRSSHPSFPAEQCRSTSRSTVESTSKRRRQPRRSGQHRRADRAQWTGKTAARVRVNRPREGGWSERLSWVRNAWGCDPKILTVAVKLTGLITPHSIPHAAILEPSTVLAAAIRLPDRRGHPAPSGR